MMRSGMAATSNARRYSGCFSNKLLLSSVELNSDDVSQLIVEGSETQSLPLYACSNSGSDGRFAIMRDIRGEA